MRCPYCVSEINPKALVCPVCRRDLFLFKPLLERIEELETELLSGSLSTQENELPEGLTAQLFTPPERSWTKALTFCLMPLLVLLTGHLLFNYVYDAKPLYLRLLALIAPLPFGILFSRWSGLSFWPGTGVAFLMAMATVLAMSGVTAVVDKVPVLPANLLEIREFIEFSTSIALSFITGTWIALWRQRRSQHGLLKLAKTLKRGLLATENGPQTKDSLMRLHDALSAVVACGTTGISIYTGLKNFIG